MIRKPIKVFLMGGDQSGWALDQDLATTRIALESIGDLVSLVSFEESDVIHSVWEEPLLRIPVRKLQGKRIICHVCNDVVRTFENGFMLKAREVIGLWVGISRKAKNDLDALKLKNTYIPYVIDTRIFKKDINKEEVQSLRAKWKIPEQAYVIGNFMRDSLGADLGKTKDQKAPEMFLEIVSNLYSRGLPVHVLLAGPRRHWLRARLLARKIPYSFVGQVVETDDYNVNVLDQSTVAALYHLINICVVTSRWEGGPRAALEAGASGAKIISTPVGLSPDVLEPECIYSAVDEGIRIIEKDITSKFLDSTVQKQYNRVIREFAPDANVPRFRHLYEEMSSVPVCESKEPDNQYSKSSITVHLAEQIKRKMFSILGCRPHSGLRICLWHEFHKPPYGGGNQFMMALRKSMERQGVSVVSNKASASVDVHICNSAWFDVRKFISLGSGQKLRIIHRVDGPIAIYRSSTWEEDNKIYSLNNKFASTTVYQSGWCYKKMLELSFSPVRPLVIRNAVDGEVFGRRNRIEFSRNRKIRLISTAWSPNPKKGGPFIRSLESRIDWGRFEYTYVGQTTEQFERIRHIPAQDSENLADILRQHDIYVMASQSEACSNALIEALACGLPALYLDDGGNGEVTGLGGLPFTTVEEALVNLERLVDNYEAFQASIWVESIESVARRYIDLAKRVMDL